MHDDEWLRALFAHIDAKDTRAFLSYLTDDAQFRFGSQPVVRGTTAIGEAVDAFFHGIGGSLHQLLGSWRSPGVVVCQGEVAYTRIDGSQITLPFVNVFHLRGERIERYLVYADLGPLWTPST